VNKKYFRPEALQFEPYQLSQYPKAMRLHQNEGFSLEPSLIAECSKKLSEAWAQHGGIGIYPHIVPQTLAQSYARYLEVEVENIEVTCGSSEGLTLLSQAFFGPRRRIAVTSPSFSLYGGHITLAGANLVPISLGSQFEYTREGMFNKDVLSCDVALICTPNNPTGALVNPDWIEEFAAQFQGPVIVDEAYFEFAQGSEARSLIKKSVTSENILVLRTLSKAWGAAGLRVGALVGAPDAIKVFKGLRPPYSIPFPSEVLGEFLLNEKRSQLDERIRITVQEREKWEQELQQISGIEVFSSQGNFIFFRHPKAKELEKFLREEKNVLVRYYGHGPVSNCIRTTLWSPEINTEVRNAFLEFFHEQN
jgi:histidinol-phosphate aminotransferase